MTAPTPVGTNPATGAGPESLGTNPSTGLPWTAAELTAQGVSNDTGAEANAWAIWLQNGVGAPQNWPGIIYGWQVTNAGLSAIDLANTPPAFQALYNAAGLTGNAAVVASASVDIPPGGQPNTLIPTVQPTTEGNPVTSSDDLDQPDDFYTADSTVTNPLSLYVAPNIPYEAPTPLVTTQALVPVAVPTVIGQTTGPTTAGNVPALPPNPTTIAQPTPGTVGLFAQVTASGATIWLVLIIVLLFLLMI
jgi:hypothetical protein